MTATRAPGDRESPGPAMHELVRELYPICRSITGDGVRQTLARLGSEIPLAIHEVPSGTPVFDWTVPPEWNIRDAWVKNSRGERVIDFHRHSCTWSATACRCGPGCRWRSCAPTCTACPSSPTDPVPHVLLPAGLGLLPAPSPAGAAARRRVRGLHRHQPRRRPPHLRRVPARGQLGAGGADLLPCLPSIPVQRQPLGRRGGHLPGPAPGPGAAPPFLPVPVHSGHDRRDHLAQPQRGARRCHRARPGAHLPRRPRRLHLQGKPARRRADRRRGAARPAALPARRTRCCRSRPTATTSGSTARPASTCPSAA